MLKRRIKRIEKGLGLKKISIKNVEYIYKFFLTGDKSLLPEEQTLGEIYIAAKKAREKGLIKCPGLFRVFNCLKKEGSVKDENDFFDYLKTRKEPSPKIIYTQDIEKEEETYQILERLGLFQTIYFVPAKLRPKTEQD